MNFKKIQDHIEKKQSSLLCDRVLSRIEGEDIKPCPRWKFWCRYFGIWVLWAVSVAIGAIAVAVMVYVANHARFALYEATHETPLSFFVEILPYVWIVCFFLMGALAYYNMRHTRHGYRYPFWQVLGSSALFSVIGGLALHFAGVGYLIDTSLGHGMPTYPSMEHKEMKMWQMPKEGRLVGVFSEEKSKDMVYEIVDTNGDEWSITVTELREPDLELLKSGNSVRILGTTTNASTQQFHACGVFPWMFDKENEVLLETERDVFVNRMHEYSESRDRLEALEDRLFDKKTLGKPFMEGTCADLDVVNRMKPTQ